MPFYSFNWEYEKEGIAQEIIATVRLAWYKSGELKQSACESEVTLGRPEWVSLERITPEICVEGEYMAIEMYKRYCLCNPFV